MHKKHILGRDGPAVPSTTKVAYRRKSLFATITILYYNYIIVRLYIYYTITILYYNCISSFFARFFFGSLLYRIPSCWGHFFLGSRLVFVASILARYFFGSFFLGARLYFGARIFRLATVLALYFFRSLLFGLASLSALP